MVNNNIFNDNINDSMNINANLERELDLCIRPPREPRLSLSIIESRFELGFSLTTCIFTSVIKPPIMPIYDVAPKICPIFTSSPPWKLSIILTLFSSTFAIRISPSSRHNLFSWKALSSPSFARVVSSRPTPSARQPLHLSFPLKTPSDLALMLTLAS